MGVRLRSLGCVAALACLAGCGGRGPSSASPGVQVSVAHAEAAAVAPSVPPAPPDPHFTIATYNINFANPHLPIVAETIETADADVVCLQETNQQSERYLRSVLGRTYPHIVFNLGSGRFGDGLGLLSRSPFELKFLPPKYGAFGVQIAELVLGGRRVQLANVHLQYIGLAPEDSFGRAFQNYQAMETIHGQEIAHVHENLGPFPALVIGDFNSLSSFRAPRFLKERGFVDSFASVRKEPDRTYTCHGPWHGQDLGMRIDYIFHKGPMRTVSSRVIRSDGSDHYLLVSWLEWAPGAEKPAPGQGAGR